MDILVYTPAEVKRLRAMHGTLLEKVEREGKVLYGQKQGHGMLFTDIGDNDVL
jgi:hypothetical protein